MSKITVWIPSMPQRSYAYRRGDAQIIYDDGGNAVIIDGGEDYLCEQIIKHCKARGITHATYILSHWHYDHDRGMQLLLNSSIVIDKIYCPPPADLRKTRDSDAVDDYSRAMGRIALAKSLHKTVIYPDADKTTTITVGAIKCNIWRRSVRPSENVDYQVNNTSLCCYFPDMSYLTTGDTINAFDQYLATKPGTIKVFKIPHHGNACTNTPCNLLKSAGAELCWYNHAEAFGTSIGGDSFSHWGALYCKNHGFTCLRPFNAIQMTCADKRLAVAQNGSKWSFDVPYEGKAYEGWIKSGSRWWYQYSDASWAVGWKKLTWSQAPEDGSWFYFDSEGWMQTGWVKTNGYWYYLDPISGAMQTGWIEYKGRQCYLEPEAGKNQGHAYCNETVTIDGKNYKFDVNCYLVEEADYEKTVEKPAINQNYNFKGYNVSRRNDPIMYVVMHYTGAEGTAKNNVDYFNGGNRSASADFFVSQNGDIWQYSPDIKTYYTWHCGGGRQSSRGGSLYGICKNANSIGIEMCTHKSNGVWIFTKETVSAARSLVMYLMKEYNIPVSKVCRHFDVNGKSCPAVPGWGAVGTDAEWVKFVKSLSDITNYDDAPEIFRVRKTWDAADTQIGAFEDIANARLLIQKYPDYHIYDKDGNEVT